MSLEVIRINDVGKLRIMKDSRLYVAEKTDGGSDFQSLEVIGINKLASSFVRNLMLNV